MDSIIFDASCKQIVKCLPSGVTAPFMSSTEKACNWPFVFELKDTAFTVAIDTSCYNIMAYTKHGTDYFRFMVEAATKRVHFYEFLDVNGHRTAPMTLFGDMFQKCHETFQKLNMPFVFSKSWVEKLAAKHHVRYFVEAKVVPKQHVLAPTCVKNTSRWTIIHDSTTEIVYTFQPVFEIAKDDTALVHNLKVSVKIKTLTQQLSISDTTGIISGTGDIKQLWSLVYTIYHTHIVPQLTNDMLNIMIEASFPDTEFKVIYMDYWDKSCWLLPTVLLLIKG